MRAPKESKKNMRKHLNQSERVHESIQRKIREVERREAAVKIDRIRRRTNEGIFNASQSIREDRDTL